MQDSGKEYNMGRLWFVILVTGPTKLPDDEAEVQKMQKAHLANFGAMHEKGLLLTAGPMKDPAKVKRGIVVFDGRTVKDRKAVMTAFKNDPYIQNGHQAVEVYNWYTARDRISSRVEPGTIEENTLVLLKKPETQPAHTLDVLQAAQKSHMDNIEAMTFRGVLGLAGPIVKSDAYAGIFVIHGNDHVAVKRWLMLDDYITGGFIEYEIIPLWLSKGTMPKGQ